MPLLKEIPVSNLPELPEAHIIAAANRWAKEEGWFDFERSDFLGCARELLRAYAEEAVKLEREAIAAMFDNVTQIRRYGVEIAAEIRSRALQQGD
jgi:hypothetical protein